MTNKRAKKKNTGSAVYAVFLILWILLLAGAILFGLSKLWKYAEEYEAARPNHVMDELIADLRENLWDDSMEATIAAMPHEFQSNAECAQIVKSMFSDELTYSRKSGGGDQDLTAVYNILCGQNLVGTVTLVQDESKADELEFGFLPWKLYKEEFYFDGLYTSLQVTAPASYSVALNGVTLGEEYIIERDIHYDVLEEYYADYPGLPTKVTYRAENIIGHLEPVIYDANGNETVLDDTRDDSQYIPPIDEATLNRLSAFSVNFANHYLAFSAGATDYGVLYNNLAPYVRAGSDLDQRLKKAIEVQVGYGHTTSYTFGSAEMTDAISLGGGYYSLSITATATATQPTGPVNVERNLRVIVLDNNGDIRAFTVEDY